MRIRYMGLAWVTRVGLRGLHVRGFVSVKVCTFYTSKSSLAQDKLAAQERVARSH